jgi:ADP-heptose:LPS heptosyltransferase
MTPGMLKNIERAWKKLWLWLICGLVRITAQPRAPLDWRTRPCRVLFLRPDRLGDAIVSTGIFRAISEASPNITLDAVGSPRNAAILRRVRHLSSVGIYNRRSPWSLLMLTLQLRRARYDAVIDCMVTAPSMTCLLLMLASGARHRIGILGRGVDAALTIHVPGISNEAHFVDQLAVFGRVFGLEAKHVDYRPALELNPGEIQVAQRTWQQACGEASPRILVNVSAGKPTRNWPADRFVEAIRHLRRNYAGSGVIVIGAPAEAERTRDIAEATSTMAVSTPRIDEVIGLVATADFVLTPDTSVGHIASALGVPAVVMYLEGISAMWGLFHSPGAIVESDSTSLDALPLERVLPLLDQILAEVSGRLEPGNSRFAV